MGSCNPFMGSFDGILSKDHAWDPSRQRLNTEKGSVAVMIFSHSWDPMSNPFMGSIDGIRS